MENVKELAIVTTSEALLEHWQGHRRLTRKVIEAFPESAFFEFNIGGMRPFSMMALEVLDLTEYGIKGIVSGQYPTIEELPHHGHNPELIPKTKEHFLEKWDEVTVILNRYWAEIPDARFQEINTAFGQYENANIDTILYFIDNEIHHRGQGTVYLRALGIEPPAFWDRS